MAGPSGSRSRLINHGDAWHQDSGLPGKTQIPAAKLERTRLRYRANSPPPVPDDTLLLERKRICFSSSNTFAGHTSVQYVQSRTPTLLLIYDDLRQNGCSWRAGLDGTSTDSRVQTRAPSSAAQGFVMISELWCSIIRCSMRVLSVGLNAGSFSRSARHHGAVPHRLLFRPLSWPPQATPARDAVIAYLSRNLEMSLQLRTLKRGSGRSWVSSRRLVPFVSRFAVQDDSCQRKAANMSASRVLQLQQLRTRFRNCRHNFQRTGPEHVSYHGRVVVRRLTAREEWIASAVPADKAG